ncbi:MAG TPA: hypothetical protein VGI99_04650, partial [Gemmataceae bacterium]
CQHDLAGFKLAANRFAPGGGQKSASICVFSQKRLIPKELRFANEGWNIVAGSNVAHSQRTDFILILACDLDKASMPIA